MRCCSLFGLETPLGNTDCSWEHPASFYIDQLGQRGFNYLRIPFSGEYIQKGDFRVMDEIFETAGIWNMSILLDWHRNINSFQDNWLENISLEDYFHLYEQLIDRYIDKPHLRMLGLFNEYKGDDPRYWKEQMEQVVLHLETKYPDRFLWLIGCPQWSGYCAHMDWSHLPFYNRVFVDHHKYIFSQPSTPQGWEQSFYHDPDHSIVGEWGYFSDHPEQVEWAHRFVDWLQEKNIRNTCFWVSVSNSGDTGGLWKDCREFEYSKYDLLRVLWDQDRLLQVSNDTKPLVIVFSQKLRGGLF